MHKRPEAVEKEGVEDIEHDVHSDKGVPQGRNRGNGLDQSRGIRWPML